MVKYFLLLLASCISMCASAQLVARMEVKEDIPGICDKNEVYALFGGFKGQVEPVCPLTEAEIAKKINELSSFLKANPKFRGKGMVGLVINCKGEVVQYRMSIKTKSEELDAQILEVFKSLGNWKPGKLNDKEVDTSELFSFTIKNGVLSFD